ncbi:hypothetical protein [Rothia nasimurium]|uniref:hypothetical protein n=1 Tax=Rothia nasimurium TaxID=85336 RepID=UPI003BA03505
MTPSQYVHFLTELPIQQPTPRSARATNQQEGSPPSTQVTHLFALQAQGDLASNSQIPVLGQVCEPGCFITEDSAALPHHLWELMVYRGDLVHLHHGIYTHHQTKLTPLFKAQSLALISPEDYLYRIRFSRYAAAWVMGYLESLPETRVDVDYDRNRRTNLPRTYRPSFAAHQTTVLPHETITLGPINLTTPLTTALDLISYHATDPDANQAVLNILTTPGNRATPETFLEAAAQCPRVKSQSYRRAQYLADLARHQLATLPASTT